MQGDERKKAFQNIQIQMHDYISFVLSYLSKNNLPNILDVVILVQLLDVSVNDLLGRAFISIRAPN